MGHQVSFRSLVAKLRELLADEGYSKSTVKDMEFIMNAFTAYMSDHDLDEYTPEIGKTMIEHCKNELHVCESRIVRANGIVRKLNRLQQGFEGREALWHQGRIFVELPKDFEMLLASYISFCKTKGNNENTIANKKWVCTRFLKELSDIGCNTPNDLNECVIQTAFLHLGYTRYWEKISPFLRYLYDEKILLHNYAELLHYRKKKTPHPTVYTPAEISVVESSIDRANAVGLRNYAIIILLSRYGIRSRDIAALTFENIDFDNNRIRFIQQKTGVLWECELFSDVKSALQEYITHARPKMENCDNIFLTAMIPHIPLDCNAINTMVYEVFKKTDVSIAERRHGSRAFRSSLASNMINDHISTEIVRKVLGHGTRYALKFYAKIDIESMKMCALSVPDPSGTFADLLSWKVGEENV